MQKQAHRKRLGRRARWLVIGLAILSAAPTAGDIGSCGQKIVPLDLGKFSLEKEAVDCSRCTECGLGTKACKVACDKKHDQVPFPDGCVPLVHDGEVCIHALSAASCSDYTSYVSDQAPTIPTECNFCPPRGVGGAGGAGGASGGAASK